ncbi:hypothetical protein [Thermococcus thioreducens]|uniref:Uncharacterized protein n=1 Tax=Thermococcus thioreducens TaxID=277988 RepID=A0A0Q2US28_9EURY|nr:hypothetical protein [Thermococcus thioreducens]ASJ11396.1 hypothetical protein A3L14_00185 [Thermococcus thioreducens]KQH83416.1 hypothetical protein AMR53_00185 [Thermococcus thioreducens]SEW07415.1 hypothetical protein SAMN05216170_1402 [Thermococcus thioreducens]
MGRFLKAFLFLVVASLALVSFLILSSGEKYPIEVEAHFSSPVEFEGAELMAGYPNEVTHVALFKFRRSGGSGRDFRFVKAFDLPVDYVVAEIRDGDMLYCRASFEDGRFVIREENCSSTLEDALKSRITLSSCINGTYLGYKIERNSIVYFLFETSNETTCVNGSAEVVGRTWGIFAEITGANGTLLCQVEVINGTYLTDEVVRINKEVCRVEN